ncbi:hypothetical protein [Nesterenkonia cremea]|nr:hypothetical protein [Nesterenkonia cremea]
MLVTPGVLKSLGEPATCASFARFLRVDKKLASPSYVFWFLQDMYLSGQMRQHEVRHTGVGRFQYTRFAESVEIPLPSLGEQRGIATTLGVLDDKIDSNRRKISLGTDLIHSCVTKEVVSEPETVAVSEIARFVNGGAYTKGATGSGRMVIRIKDLNSGPGASTVYNDIDVPDDKTARPGDLLMSWSGTLGVYRWFRDEAIINQHIFKVLPSGFPDWLVYDRLHSVIAEFQAIAKDKATTMGHIKRGHLESTRVALPEPNTIEALNSVLGPLWERLKVAEQENRKLEALRDALLPELLSGRIRVPEAAEAVKEAVS